jgi:putative transposase
LVWISRQQGGVKPPQSKGAIVDDWPHSPIHRLTEAGAYIVTCGTYLKQHHFRGRERLGMLCEAFLGGATKYGWNLQVWAVFSNHYHFVALSSPDASNLRTFLNGLHSQASRAVNQEDGAQGRQVWYQYWDTHLTYQRSYFARLSYVHRNAVHHGLVKEPCLYPWCSASWLQRRGPTSFYKTIMNFGIERLKLHDDFQVECSAD